MHWKREYCTKHDVYLKACRSVVSSSDWVFLVLLIPSQCLNTDSPLYQSLTDTCQSLSFTVTLKHERQGAGLLATGGGAGDIKGRAACHRGRDWWHQGAVAACHRGRGWWHQGGGAGDIKGAGLHDWVWFDLMLLSLTRRCTLTNPDC